MTVWYRVCKANLFAASFWIHILICLDHWSSCYMVSPACNWLIYFIGLSLPFPEKTPRTARLASINYH